MGITSREIKCHGCTLIDFEKMMDEWDKKTATDQTWTSLEIFIINEYAKLKEKLDECMTGAAGLGNHINYVEEQSVGKKAMIAANMEMMEQLTKTIKSIQASPPPHQLLDHP